MNVEIVLASANAKKAAELAALLPQCTILSLKDIGFSTNIEEPYFTFKENAFQKANTIFQYSNKNVLADDSGLCVEALNGAPGVLSARYATPNAVDTSNNLKLLEALKGQQNRKAYYVAVLCFILNGESYFFEGYCHGHIAHEPQGEGGFGYDPIFIPNGYTHTFGQLDSSIKKQISHRAQAMQQLQSFLNSIGG